MTILGISALYHDSAAVVVRDGEIIATVQEERFTRKKADASIILNGHDDVFEDPCHVNEAGNKIIAENVFELLKQQKAL